MDAYWGIVCLNLCCWTILSAQEGETEATTEPGSPYALQALHGPVIFFLMYLLLQKGLLGTSRTDTPEAQSSVPTL